MKLPSWLKDVLTTRDGESFDVIRVGMVLSCATLLGLAAWDVVVNKNTFNALTFGSGVAALFAGGGVGIGAKAKDEPDA
jgi:hypothetical protein